MACTKRTVLSLIARVFDPCGFISPFTIYAKLLFQDIWKVGVSWDDRLPPDLEIRFSQWIESCKYLSSVKIERPYFPNVLWKGIVHLEIHGFGDALERLMGLVYT